MRIVVTGGAGFIGSHCVDLLLDRGHDVTVVDDFSTGCSENLETARELATRQGRSLIVLKTSITDPTLWTHSLGSADAIFHLAAQPAVLTSVTDPHADFRANVEPLPLIVDWLRRSRVRYAIYANTAGAVYGNAETVPTDERHYLRPVSPHGATKAFFELYLAAVSASLKSQGVWSSNPAAANYFSWVSLRLANVYGPRQRAAGDSAIVPTFIRKIAAGETPLVFGATEATRDYVHVSDVVSAFEATFDRLGRSSFDDAFNVATSVDVSALQIFDHVLDAMIERAEAEGGLGGRLAGVYGVKEAQQGALRAGEVRRSSLSTLKVQTYFDWKPMHALEEGIRSTVFAYKL